MNEVLAPLGMIGGDSADQTDVAAGNPGPLPLKPGELVLKNCLFSRQLDAGWCHPTEGPEDQNEP